MIIVTISDMKSKKQYTAHSKYNDNNSDDGENDKRTIMMRMIPISDTTRFSNTISKNHTPKGWQRPKCGCFTAYILSNDPGTLLCTFAPSQPKHPSPNYHSNGAGDCNIKHYHVAGAFPSI
eukprot:scaffold655255_cov71-Prasinocladus_malaysianus.AAC.1